MLVTGAWASSATLRYNCRWEGNACAQRVFWLVQIKKNYHNVPETKLEKRDIFKVLLINIFSVAYGTVNAKPVPRGGSRNRVLVDEP